MAALAQCDAFAFIYDQAGDPAPDILVTLKRVLDASGNPILLGPLTTLTDPAGSFHFTLPEDATAYISARATTLWNCPDGRAFKVPAGPTGELIPTFLLPESSVVVPPLVYVSDTLSITRSSSTSDGYLAAADYVRFDAATDITGGVSSFAARTGDITPLVGDYQAFYLKLTGGALTGALTLAADPTMPMQAATMQYVLNQLASATAGVSSFNLRTGVVTPQSGDYASFYAPTAHSHTRSQITDLGVFSTSAPGLVPQPTSGDAAKVLTGAGTWVTQSAVSGTTLPGTYLASDYKASGSKLQFTGTISSGSSTLTITAGTPDFVVGQGIYIAGGGTGGTVPLITKVTAISGTTITLQNPALANVTAITNNVQHDDSAAINAALQAVFDAGGGTLYFAPGWYRVNGPIGSADSIIKLPYNATTNPSIGISMVGQPQPGMCFSSGGVGPAQHGVIIQSDVVNTAASIFAAAHYSATLTDLTWFNNITLFMDGFTFRSYDNPQINAVDLAGCDNICIRNIQIDAAVPFLSAAQPTATTCYGLRTPAVSAGMANHFAENVAIYNYGIGLVFSEMIRGNLVQVFRCLVGMQALPSYYPARFYSSLIWHCPTGISIPAMTGNARAVLDMSLDIEFNTTGGWDIPLVGRDLYDPTNKASGTLRVMKVSNDGIGTAGVISMTGFANADVFDLATGTHLTLQVNNLLATDASVGSDFRLAGQLVSFGANESADATGYRELQVPNPIAGTGLLTSLLSYWKLDEAAGTGNRADSVSANTLVASASIGTSAGKTGFNLAAHFIADGNSLTAANSAGLTMGAVDYTIAAWVYLADKTADRDFMGKAGSAGFDEYILGYKQSAGADRFRFSVKGPSAYHEVLASSVGSPAINTWYLVVVWHDETAGTVNIQINNGSVNSLAMSEPPATGINGCHFGCYGAGEANYWSGLVDEVAIWKSRLLSTGDRTTLWNGGAGLPFASW